MRVKKETFYFKKKSKIFYFLALNTLFVYKCAYFVKLILAKHAKTSVENSRNENIQKLTQKFEARESELVNGIEALQARYCTCSLLYKHPIESSFYLFVSQ